MSNGKVEKYNDEDIKIRGMVEADSFALTEILMDPVLLSWFPMTDLNEVNDAVRVWQMYARKNSAYTVDIDNIPVAMAVIYVNSFEKLAHQSLFAIVVDPKYRNRGIGTHLLRHIMKEAKNTFGITLLHLEVYEGNPAYNLYSREGFSEYGKHKKFLKQRDGTYGTKILMQISL